ncbi:MAG: galactose-1-phosphate uridylyltransferase [Candidatus Gallimonas sp.]
MKSIYAAVEKLVGYAQEKLSLPARNALYVRNTVLGILGSDGFESTGAEYAGESVTELLGGLLRASADENLISEEDFERIGDLIMGVLTPAPQEIQERFEALCAEDSQKATDWLYDLSVYSDYVKKEKLDLNPRFERKGLIVTINKAKPEFRDSKKAAMGNSTKSGYPKCTICRENEGYFGRNKRTLRTVSIKLGGEDWFWQFSPYGYFRQHGIAVNTKHTPMHVDEATFYRLMDFVDRFPQWFLGCNAALPRIGGSVLAHDHYQGGGEVLPLQKARVAIAMKHPSYPDAEVAVLDWPGTAVRITAQSRETVASLSEIVRKFWVGYSNAAAGIVAEDADGIHSAVSPTVVKKDGRYEMTLILRNNITSEQYPDGVFHAHPEFHVIKKESIGLIEAQGLFILPGRLEEQMGRLAVALERGEALPADLSEFEMIFGEMKAMRPSFNKEQAEEAVKEELASVCERILGNTAVFATAEETANFMKEAGFVL